MMSHPGPRVQTEGVRVFVSSTFRDMQAERDQLVRRTFPQLRRWCEERGITFTEIDLRWGVTTTEKDQGLVLPICLEEIDRCRPFFIGLLGSRYGWIENEFSAAATERYPWLHKYAGRSLTELEMVHGGVGSTRPSEQAFFYFRDPAAEPMDLPPEPPESHAKLVALRERIAATGRVLHGAYRSPQELGEWILQDLQAALQPFLPTDAGLDAAARETAAQQYSADLCSRLYVGTREGLDLLSAHYFSDGPPLLVTGEPGSGKSALTATWCRLARGGRVPRMRLLPSALTEIAGGMLGREWIDSHAVVAQPEVLIHLGVGITAATLSAEGVAERLLQELKARSELVLLLPQRAGALAALPSFLDAASRRHRVCLVIDGLDHFPAPEREKLLAALPEPFPAAIRLVLTSSGGDVADAARRRAWRVWAIPSWKEAARRHFSRAYLTDYRKTLEPQYEDLVSRALQTGNPLYLRTLLEELRVAVTHSTFKDRIAAYLGAPDLTTLFTSILPRWENDLEHVRPGLVGDALRLLWIARRGLAESELRELLGADERLPDAAWSPLAITLGPHLAVLDGTFSLPRGALRNAVEGRYFPDIPSKLSAHGVLADYFGRARMGRRVVEESAWHLIASRRWDEIAAHLADPAFLLLAWKIGRDDLLAAAEFLEHCSDHRLTVIFARMAAGLGAAFVAGMLLLARGNLEEAHPYFVETEAEALRNRDAAAASEAAGTLALIDRRRGRPAEALRRLETLERDARAREDWLSVALHLGQRGEILRAQGHLDAAQRAHREESELAQRSGDEGGIAAALGRLAAVDFARQHFAAALERFTAQSALYQRLGDQAGLAGSLGNRAATLTRLGRGHEALALHRLEETVLRQRGDRWALQISLGNQAAYYRVEGNYDQAMRCLDEKEEICHALGSPEALAKTWLQLSQLLDAIHQFEGARRYAAEAEKLAREHRLVALQTAIRQWQSRLN